MTRATNGKTRALDGNHQVNCSPLNKHKFIDLTMPDVTDGANKRARKTEYEGSKAITGLRSELATAKQKLQQQEAAIKNMSSFQTELVILKQTLEEAETAVVELKKAEEAAKKMRCTAAKLEIEAIKKKMKQMKTDNEKKMEEMKTDNEKKIDEMQQKLEKSEKEKEKDPEYAELKKKLGYAKVMREIDDDMITRAFTQVVELKRELGYAKTKSKSENNEESKDDASKSENDEESKDYLKGCSSELISRIEEGIIDRSSVTMDDIAGLEFAKKCVNELVVWPMSRPDIFTGLRALPRGLLLFGPPGTGKTMIGKAIATQSGATFFYISASSIASKWAGESEQLVRTLFAVASAKQPSVIFIDEIDSMLTKRSDDDSGFRRAIKTEFMVQLDGMSPNSKDSILIIGATNCPHTLDKAIRRRFVKRMYIPLPATDARAEFMKHALREVTHNLAPDDFKCIAESTDGFSCADMHALCTEAALGPVREIADIRNVNAADIRAIHYKDFAQAFGAVKSSVGAKDLKLFEDWNAEFGSFPV